MRRTVFQFVPGRRWLATHVGGLGTGRAGGGKAAMLMSMGKSCSGGAGSGDQSLKTVESAAQNSVFQENCRSPQILWGEQRPFQSNVRKFSKKKMSMRSVSTLHDGQVGVAETAWPCSKRAR